MTLIVSFQMAKSLLSETLQYGHSGAKLSAGKKNKLQKQAKEKYFMLTLLDAYCWGTEVADTASNSMYHACS